MVEKSTNLHPVFGSLLSREEKEELTGQRACVVWLYGLSGSGKSTLAAALERRMHNEGRITAVLDGDNLRTGLNRDLGFSDLDRKENIRRIAEVSRLFLQSGIIVINSFITPTRGLRGLARTVVGEKDFFEVYVKCSFETCAKRDVKGLYAKSKSGDLKEFTGKDSVFEPPESPDLVLDTENETVEACLNSLCEALRPRIRRTGHD